ncbi:hypothetical protein H6P81_010907 [Aristolochia fimbriata]|uniref:Uncharacterized protein n=1 Tax=Aristolochia fimbriata TaxID=158543 RepID=A0AAV7ETH6_ARIFI|nr:hypothetical protein H6P81_010907 [Aristolochia fimbriata]
MTGPTTASSSSCSIPSAPLVATSPAPLSMNSTLQSQSVTHTQVAGSTFDLGAEREHFISGPDGSSVIQNPHYMSWYQLDKTIESWIVSTLSGPALRYLVGLNMPAEL